MTAQELQSLRNMGGLAEDAADEIARLRLIIDSRPAINAGLPETYIEWSQGIYMADVARAVGYAA